jgi:hypothetical protein
MKVIAEECKGSDLQPGDLFSTVGQTYWDRIDARYSIGERVYIRTNEPSTSAPDESETVFRIRIER